MRIVSVWGGSEGVDNPIKDICIGVDSHVTESCTDEKGEYVLRGMSERLYMIDVGIREG